MIELLISTAFFVLALLMIMLYERMAFTKALKNTKFESVTNRGSGRKIRMQTPWGFVYGMSPTSGIQNSNIRNNALHYRWYYPGSEDDWDIRRLNWWREAVMNTAIARQMPHLVK